MTDPSSGVTPGRFDPVWLIVGAACLFLLSLGARDLWNPNEPIYGQAVTEMAARGEWVVPTVNGEIFAEKPILYFWLARVSALALGGPAEFALRVPSAIAGILGVLFVYLLVLPDGGRVRAIGAACLFGTTYVVWWSGRSVQMDLLVTTTTLAAVCAATRVLDHGWPATRGWILAGAAAGLGFLAKGPVGVILPGLVILSYLGTTRRLGALRWRDLVVAAAACAAVAAPWILALAARGGTEALAEMFLRQNVTRFLDPWDHEAGWWYFLVNFWIDMAPWSVFVPLALALPGRDDDDRRLDRLAWCWILVVIAFFSLSASKRSAYILPVAPAVAILVSGLAERIVTGRLEPWRRRTVLVLIASFGVVLLVVGAYLRARVLPEYPMLETEGRAVAILLFAGGAAMLGAMTLGSRAVTAAGSALFAFVVCLFLLAGVVVLPAANVYKSARPFCASVAAHVGSDETLHAYRLWSVRASYNYYTGRTIVPVRSPDELRRLWEAPEPFHVIVEGYSVEELLDTIGDVEPRVSRPIGGKQAYLFVKE